MFSIYDDALGWSERVTWRLLDSLTSGMKADMEEQEALLILSLDLGFAGPADGLKSCIFDSPLEMLRWTWYL